MKYRKIPVVIDAIWNWLLNLLPLKMRRKSFTPSDVSAIYVWHKFNTGKTIVDGVVTHWQDHTGNGHHLIGHRQKKTSNFDYHITEEGLKE